MGDSYEVDGVRVYTGVEEALARLADDTVIGFDLETSGLSPWDAKIATVQLFGDDSGVGALLHVKGSLPVALVKFFEREDGPLFIGHNITAFDCLFLATHGVDVFKAKWYDSMTIEMVVAGYGRKNVSMSLKDALVRRLGVVVSKDIDHGGWMNPVLTEEQEHYAMSDVIHLPALRRAQLEKAQQTDQLGVVDFEMALLPAVLAMTLNGLPVRKSEFDAYVSKQEQQVDDANQELVNFLHKWGAYDHFAPKPVYTKTGKESAASIRARAANATEWINLNSPTQVKNLLSFCDIHLGDTKAETLQLSLQEFKGLEKQTELLNIILKYREGEQRMKMYGGDWYIDNVVPDKDNKGTPLETGRIHPKYRQCGADTGRFTCKEPNTQQIPKDARTLFGGRDKWSVISCDYSAIEVRVAAYLAQDEALLAALNQEDFHTAVAAMVFNIPQDQVTKELRKIAKAMSFTLLFGGQAYLLWKNAQLNGAEISVYEAEELVDRFFERFKGLKAQREFAQRLAREKTVLWIKLPNGLKRMLTGADLRPQVILNTTVQGSAGVGLKRALIALGKDPDMRKYLVATVHDEIVAYVPDDKAEAYAEKLRETMVLEMEATFKGRLPIKAEVVIGKTWGHGQPVRDWKATRSACGDSDS